MPRGRPKVYTDAEQKERRRAQNRDAARRHRALQNSPSRGAASEVCNSNAIGSTAEATPLRASPPTHLDPAMFTVHDIPPQTEYPSLHAQINPDIPESFVRPPSANQGSQVDDIDGLTSAMDALRTTPIAEDLASVLSTRSPQGQDAPPIAVVHGATEEALSAHESARDLPPLPSTLFLPDVELEEPAPELLGDELLAGLTDFLQYEEEGPTSFHDDGELGMDILEESVMEGDLDANVEVNEDDLSRTVDGSGVEEEVSDSDSYEPPPQQCKPTMWSYEPLTTYGGWTGSFLRAPHSLTISHSFRSITDPASAILVNLLTFSRPVDPSILSGCAWHTSSSLPFILRM